MLNLLRTCFFICLISLSNSHASTLKIMSYNVENLFDTEHDQDKNDWEFIPKSNSDKQNGCKVDNFQSCGQVDWTENRLKMKLQNIKDAILSANGQIPDMLGVVEIENNNVATMLQKTLGFNKFVMTNSPDKRGIDVALFFNESTELKYVDFSEINVTELLGLPKLTRNVLQVHFKLKNEDLYVYVNHWPSPKSPAESRMNIAQKLKEIIALTKTKNPNSLHMLMGDFNTLSTDKPNAITEGILMGENALNDIDRNFRKTIQYGDASAELFPKGTHYFAPDHSWGLMDRFIVSGNLLDKQGIDINLSSYRVVYNDFLVFMPKENSPKQTNQKKQPFQKKNWGSPKRCDHNANNNIGMGFSDHLPIYVELNY